MTSGIFGSWAWALKRALTRLEQAREVAATGAISGAVGTYSSIDPFVEQYVCEKLGLTPDPLSTRIRPATAAQVLAALATTASTLESIALQVPAQRSERHRAGTVAKGARGLQRDNALAQPHHGRARLRLGPRGQGQRPGGL